MDQKFNFSEFCDSLTNDLGLTHMKGHTKNHHILYFCMNIILLIYIHLNLITFLEQLIYYLNIFL